jgi:dipeptidyl aminopeptidase/acylaminoacyl peptidase
MTRKKRPSGGFCTMPPHTITLDDLSSLKTLGTIALSPNGRRVAFELYTTDTEQDETRCTLWLLLLDEDGNALDEPRQLTRGKKSAGNPVWAPDSQRLLFLSTREDDRPQLWLLDTDGGEASCLTHVLHGVVDASWSPDGKWIAFIAPADLTDEDDVVVGRKTLDEAARKKYDAAAHTRLRTINRTLYRMDGRGLFERFSQLFVLPAPTSHANSVDPATIRRLTHDSIDYTQPSWTPDSLEIGIVCNRSANRDRTFADDLWAINPETAEERRLTDGTLSTLSYAWSPDGQAVIVVGEKEMITQGLHTPRLYLVTRRGNVGDNMLELTPDLDNATYPMVNGAFGTPGPYRPVWGRDGQQVYFLVTEHGCVIVYRLDIVWRILVRLTDASVTYFLALLAGDRALLLVQEHEDHPSELYRIALTEQGTTEKTRITHLYDGFLAEIVWAKTERIRYEGANGDEIEGWLIHPIAACEGERYPLLVRIHGGPNWSYGIGIDPFDHYFAAQGFAIFYCNPHGSTGYGHEFMRAVVGDWGGWDYQDIMRGVDACIAHGNVDPERLAVTGYSYGGYMSMFIIGQTDRFKAAVPMAGISNLVSMVGTSDIGIWQAAQALGYPWEAERADYYHERSPLTYAPRVTTPTLFLHPENDLRCPIEQSEQFYTALKIIESAPTEFIRVPGAWHGGRKPSQWPEYWVRMLEWVRKYI